MGALLDKRMKGKANTNGFDKNPQNIVGNGRPKKGIALVNSQLASEGYTPASKEDIEVNYMSMLQLGEERMKQLAVDKEQPMLIRILAKNILGGKGFDIVEKIVDRGIGKPKQTTENKHTFENTLDISELTD